MINPTQPWPTPPPDPYRANPYKCHNCNSEENTLSVGTWMSGAASSKPNGLVLCEKCFDTAKKAIFKWSYPKPNSTLIERAKFIFFGEKNE